MVRNGRIDRALRDRVALEMAILGVTPGSLRAVKAAGARGVFVDPLLAVGVEADQQIALGAVMDDRA